MDRMLSIMKPFTPTITVKHCNAIIQWMLSFELRKDHPEALNSPYLGLHDVFFIQDDKSFLFDLFNVNMADMRKAIATNPNIPKNGIVLHDPINHYIVYLVHVILTSRISKSKQMETCIALLKMLHYKFFTSLVFKRYPYGANEAIMKRTIESLSGKYDIKQSDTSTWRKLITHKANDVLTGIHKKTMQQYKPDKAIFYIITDIQSRLRSTIQLITTMYHKMKAQGDAISSYSLSTEINGEQVLQSINTHFDRIIQEMTVLLLHRDRFIIKEGVEIASKLTGGVQVSDINTFLNRFHELANIQYKKNTFKKVKKSNEITLYLGYQIFLKTFLETTIKMLMSAEKEKPINKASILIQVVNLYRVSRIIDPTILNLKATADYYIKHFRITYHDNKIPALRIAIFTYLMYLTLIKIV